MMFEFTLPDLGENVSTGTVSKILVSVGDVVSKGQTVLEIETDKAVAEIPASAGGKIVEIKVAEGQKISAGQLILMLDSAVALDAPSASSPSHAVAAKPGQPPVLRPSPSSERKAASVRPGGARAAPSVRKLARDRHIDINHVPTSDPSGRVTAQDVLDYADQQSAAAVPSQTEDRIVPPASLESLVPKTEAGCSRDSWGPVETEPMNAIRQKAAVHLSHCWRTIPHVTHFDKADITELESFRRRNAARLEKQGVRLTITAFVIQLLPEALKQFPRFNASVDMESQSILLKRYYHIGVAVDTPHGLVVPVLRNVAAKKVMEISREMSDLSQKARDRRLALSDMQGGTFTVSNLGGVGGHAFTPIINAPEAAILGISRAQLEPQYLEQTWQPRLMLPLSLSYDHRIIDGADAARFLRCIVEMLSQPWQMALGV